MRRRWRVDSRNPSASICTIAEPPVRGGRVCEADVREAERTFRLVPDPVAASTDGADTSQHTAPEFETIPFNSMRKAIGQRLQESKRNAPHFRLTVDLEIDNLLALRKEINATVPSVKLSVNDFVVKACAAALRKVPDVNVQFDEAAQSVLRFSAADISVAVALPSGLITPIVRGAESKSLAEISGEVHALVTKAKTGKLTPAEFQGGTFTISNLGMFGVREFDAIINPPQAPSSPSEPDSNVPSSSTVRSCLARCSPSPCPATTG